MHGLCSNPKIGSSVWSCVITMIYGVNGAFVFWLSVCVCNSRTHRRMGKYYK